MIPKDLSQISEEPQNGKNRTQTNECENDDLKKLDAQNQQLIEQALWQPPKQPSKEAMEIAAKMLASRAMRKSHKA